LGKGLEAEGPQRVTRGNLSPATPIHASSHLGLRLGLRPKVGVGPTRTASCLPVRRALRLERRQPYPVHRIERERELEPRVGTCIELPGSLERPVALQLGSIALKTDGLRLTGCWQPVLKVRRRTENGEAPGWQGGTTENIGNI
jgi:hypothetical protein